MASSIKIRAKAKGGVTTVKSLMSHPMETGQRKDKKGGKIPVPKSLIKGSIDMFVVDEWTFGGGSHDLYVEIIGPGDDSGLLSELSKQWVTLKESRNSTK